MIRPAAQSIACSYQTASFRRTINVLSIVQVKTEQVHSGGQSSYSYSTEVKSAPAVVQTHTAVAAAPAAVVAHTVPATYAYNYGYYPSVASYSSYYPYAAYSPYHYVVGK